MLRTRLANLKHLYQLIYLDQALIFWEDILKLFTHVNDRLYYQLTLGECACFVKNYHSYRLHFFEYIRSFY